MFGSLLRRGKTAPETSPSPQPINLSDRQLILLSKAAAREDSLVLPPDGMAPEDFGSAFGPLVRLGLVARDDGSREDGFRITVAGLAAIGIDDRVSENIAPEDKSAAPISATKPRTSAGESRRSTTRQPSKLTEKFRPDAPASGSSSKRRTRAGGKTDQFDQSVTQDKTMTRRQTVLIALLQRPEGATLKQICAAFAWLPHSGRAALSGLRKAGNTLERKTGPDGKEAFYRIVDLRAGELAPSIVDEATNNTADVCSGR